MTWFKVWVEINLGLVSGGMQNWLFFWSGDCLDFSVEVEINLVLCGGYKLTSG